MDFLPACPYLCQVLSNSLHKIVKSYETHENRVFYCDGLFSSEDVVLFLGAYELALISGMQPLLVARDRINLYAYIKGTIELKLSTLAPTNGTLSISFADIGQQCVPVLRLAQMIYTAPKPGYFQRVTLDEENLILVFYVENFDL
jgi:hypothetical protein